MKKFLFAGLALLLTSSPAFAHEFILKPVQDSGRLQVEAQAAHVFMVSEEAEPLKDVALFEVHKGLAKNPLKLLEDAAHNCLVAELPGLDATYIVEGHRKPQIWSDTTEDVLEGDRASLEAKGHKVLSVGKYEKFAKLLMNASENDTKIYNKVLGNPLEIELLSNPATVKAGGEIEFRILWQGKPLKTEVNASFDGFTKKEDTYAVQAASNAEGIAKFKVEQPGLWFIRVSVTENNVDDADKWIVRAAYTFEIK